MIFDKFKVYESFLSKKECSDILKKCLTELELNQAEVYDDKISNKVINDKRKSKVAFTKLNSIDEKIFNKLQENFNIKGFNLKLSNYQFTEYKKGDYFNWHTDSSETMLKERFLTIAIQLSDSYEGGEFDILVDNKEIEMQSGIGNLFVFLSSSRHRVREIKNGVRYSIVNWLELEPQKDYKKTLL